MMDKHQSPQQTSSAGENRTGEPHPYVKLLPMNNTLVPAAAIEEAAPRTITAMTVATSLIRASVGLPNPRW